MFEQIDKETRDMLDDSGDMQRAYVVNQVYEEMYDSFVAKNADKYNTDGTSLLHNAAQQHAILMMNFVFGQGR